MVNIKTTNLKILILYFSLIFILFSCNKNDQSGESSTEKIRIEVKASVSDFATDLTNRKMAANYSYEPTQIYSIDYNKDFILQAELQPLSYDYNNNIVSSKLLASNTNNRAVTRAIDDDDVYRLMVFDTDGILVASRDYIRTKEDDTEALSLYRNKTYTFISYSLNSTRIDSLESLLNTLPNGTTRTLANTSITLQGNQDLLFYKKVLKTSNSANDYLGIILDHQFNLVRTTINVAESGYSMAQTVVGNLISKTNSVTLNFAKPSASSNENDYGVSRTLLNNTQHLSFTYSTAPGSSVSNSLATSKPMILNVGNGENILEITTLKIGEISNSSNYTPYLNGITLTPGAQYNLSVTMVPKDSLYILDGEQVARINGQVWMRYNLGASGIDNNSSNPDDYNNSSNFLGYYYQWGQSKPSVNINGAKLDGYTNLSIKDANYYKVWNAGTETAPIKGSNDPCPNGFRLPTQTEYNFLISSTQNSVSWDYVGTKGANSYALQLTSKRNKNVKLTFPGQGFFTVATDNQNSLTNTLASSVSNRGTYALARTSTYYPMGTGTAPNNTTVYSFQYTSFQGNNGASPSIYRGPSGGRVSASIPAHPVRCIADAINSRILLNDRAITTNNQTVGFE